MNFAFSPAAVWPIALLLCSNVFMTFAWYGHLKYGNAPLWLVILISWASPSSNIAWRSRPTASAIRSIRPPS